MQIRSVECVDSHGAHNTQCEPSTRPAVAQSCATGISCTSEMPSTDSDNDDDTSDSPNEANLDASFDRVADDVTEEDDDDQRNSKPSVKSTSGDDETEEEDDDMQGDDPRERTRHIPLAYQYRIPRAERLVDPNAPNEPT